MSIHRSSSNSHRFSDAASISNYQSSHKDSSHERNRQNVRKMLAEADKRHVIATASKVETKDESAQQFPPHRICTIKMFLILFLQATLQTFSCSYVSKKWEKEKTLKNICWLSCFSLSLCIAICSIFGTKMRKRPYISIPLFLIYCLSLEGAIIYLGMNFFTPDHAMMSSIM